MNKKELQEFYDKIYSFKEKLESEFSKTKGGNAKTRNKAYKNAKLAAKGISGTIRYNPEYSKIFWVEMVQPQTETTLFSEIENADLDSIIITDSFLDRLNKIINAT